jgi:hypothetical protein
MTVVGARTHVTLPAQDRLLNVCTAPLVHALTRRVLHEAPRDAGYLHSVVVARELHPWNDGFVWRDHGGPFSTISAAQAQEYDEVGCFVFADAFSADELRTMDDAIEPGEALVRDFLAGRPDGRFSVAGIDTQTVAPHLVMHSALLRAVCAQPPLSGIARDLLGPDVRLYWEQADCSKAG